MGSTLGPGSRRAAPAALGWLAALATVAAGASVATVSITPTVTFTAVAVLAAVVATALAGVPAGVLGATAAALGSWYLYAEPRRHVSAAAIDVGRGLATFGVVAAAVATIALARAARQRDAERRADDAELAGLSRFLLDLAGVDAEARALDRAAATARATEVELAPASDDEPPAFDAATEVLVDIGDRPTRYLRFRFPEPVTPALAARAGAVAAQCAPVLLRLARAQILRVERAEAAFLSQAAMLLMAPLDVDGIERVLGELMVPALTDWFVVEPAEPGPRFSSRRGPREPVGGVRLGFELHARGRVAGSFAAGRHQGIFTAREVEIIERLAGRVALALDNARLVTDEARTMTTLEGSLLPVAFVAVDGLSIASRYVAAAGGGRAVGGDFYDAVRLPGGGVTLIVGDVQGKGVEAAALTSMARHTLRSAALEGAGPADMLARLNRALLYGQDEQAVGGRDPVIRFVTAAVATLRRAEGSAFDATVACGGQPAPLVMRAGGSIELLAPKGMLLGVSERPDFDELRTTLVAAEALVLYTDGVTEQRRGEDVFSEAHLGRLVRNRLAPVDAGGIADLICDTALLVADGKPRDDIAVLVAAVIC